MNTEYEALLLKLQNAADPADYADDVYKQYQEMKHLQAQLDRQEKLYKALVDTTIAKLTVRGMKPEQKAELAGALSTMKVGPIAQQTVVTDKKFAAELLKDKGSDVVEALMKFNLTDLRKWLDPNELTCVTKTERTGSRRVTWTAAHDE